MSTAAQILANRVNAQHSTGPVTAAGIENCKHNATKHGLSGKQIVVKGEDFAAYVELHASLIDTYRPANELEAMLVESIAQSYWRLQRAERVEAQLTAELGEVAIFTCPVAAKKYALFMRHRTAIERSWRRSMLQLEKLITVREKSESSKRSFQAFLGRPIGSVSQSPEVAAKTDSVKDQWPARNQNPSIKAQACVG